MAEFRSPNATQVQKKRATILSPVNTFVLGSNDDKLERAQARAARAASIRRKSVSFNKAADDNPTDDFLGQEQIMELFQNCIKLASENKITQKNTWELNLIDHIHDIIKVEETDAETNFQKASCTLEAGVKIYSTRVDSVHSEAYKVLGSINRVGQDLEEDIVEASNTQRKQTTKKEHEQKLSPLSTLESSFDNLNLKKFDVAFTVDPLYHQTSAQFDEGGAKGLLLNNLRVYGGCRVVFDSLEVPSNCMSCSFQSNKIETIDITHLKDCLEEMTINISKNKEISPTLKEIVDMFDDKRPLDTFNFAQNPQEPDNDDYAPDDGDQNDNFGTWDFGNDNEGTYEREEELHEDNEPDFSHDHDVDDGFIKIDDFLFPRKGLTTSQNAWAGPDHWKYQKSKGLEASTNENGSPLLSKKPRTKKQIEPDIDFTKALENDIIDPFSPPKNPKSLLLPTNREPCNTTLPEDCHYHPENLVKLFLLPNLLCFGKKKGRRHSDEEHGHHQETNPNWDDDDCGIGDQFDDGNAYSDVEETLVSQPRQVEKIDIQYDKKSKQVDVHILKDSLWSTIQQIHQSTTDEDLSFKSIWSSFTSTSDDVTPHLSIICILHLANEHGLTLNSSPEMDDVSIHLP